MVRSRHFASARRARTRVCCSASVREAIGCDTDPVALACTQENIQASGYTQISVFPWEAGALPMPDACVDAVLADLPFGQVVGSHTENIVLYPRILDEAARVTI